MIVSLFEDDDENDTVAVTIIIPVYLMCIYCPSCSLSDLEKQDEPIVEESVRLCLFVQNLFLAGVFLDSLSAVLSPPTSSG